MRPSSCLRTLSVGCVLSILLIAASVGQADGAFVKPLTDCESLDGWSEGARLVSEAFEGSYAVAARMEGGRRAWQSGGLTFDFSQTDADLSKAHAVSFLWRAEGQGLRGLYVRLRNYPLADGLENLYVVWDEDSGSDPSGWQRATFIVAEPDREGWGREPDREARTLRFQTRLERGTSVELYVDDIVVVAPTFEWTVKAPELAEAGWEAPVTLRNVTDGSLSIAVGRGDRVLTTEEFAPGTARDIRLPMPETFATDLEPLQMDADTVWAEVQGLPVTRQSATTRYIAPIELPDHPRLLFNDRGIRDLERRIDQHGWARAIWDSTLENAKRLLVEPVEIPPRGGNWWHWHVSPKTGAALEKGRQIGPWAWEHVDPVSGEVFLGDPTNPERDYDGVVIYGIHYDWARAIRELGVAYRVTGDRRYAEKAREILLGYAKVYPGYALHDNFGRAVIGGGKVGAHVLNEATWLIPVCQGADLVWDTLSREEQTAIARDLLQPAARDVILAHTRYSVHNIQCWKNTAMGLVGFLLGDTELIWEAIDNPARGYRTQMAEGVGPGGMWWEGTWHYHWFTMTGVWGLTEAAGNCGLDLYGDAFKRMFDAPLRFAMPNWRLPAFNDGFESDLKPRGYIYELGYDRYRDPDYLPLLAQTERDHDLTLWFGQELEPDAKRPAWRSFNDAETGFAVLARGEGEQATWLCLDYGPHGGGHGHPDKLGFVLTAGGVTVGIDPGTARYGLPVQGGWYKTTLAHNTLLVDETPQRRAEGRCLAFGTAAGVDFVVAEAGPIYDGVRFRRSVALVDTDLVVFIDQVTGDREHVLDIAFHTPGTWRDLPEGLEWAIPDTIGYRYLRDATVRMASEGTVLRTRVDSTWGIAIGLAGGNDTEAITATGVGEHMEDRVPTAIFRRRAQETAFGWCVALDGKPPEMRWLAVSDSGGRPMPRSRAAALQIKTSDGQTRVLAVNPEGEAIWVGMPTGDVWRTREVFGAR